MKKNNSETKTTKISVTFEHGCGHRSIDRVTARHLRKMMVDVESRADCFGEGEELVGPFPVPIGAFMKRDTTILANWVVPPTARPQAWWDSPLVRISSEASCPACIGYALWVTRGGHTVRFKDRHRHSIATEKFLEMREAHSIANHHDMDLIPDEDLAQLVLAGKVGLLKKANMVDDGDGEGEGFAPTP